MPEATVDLHSFFVPFIHGEWLQLFIGVLPALDLNGIGVKETLQNSYTQAPRVSEL